MVHSHCRASDQAEIDYGLLTLHATPQLYALQQSILYVKYIVVSRADAAWRVMKRKKDALFRFSRTQFD